MALCVYPPPSDCIVDKTFRSISLRQFILGKYIHQYIGKNGAGKVALSDSFSSEKLMGQKVEDK